ncbi:MAG: hypothetical protein Q4E18_00855 [Clostridia bacterium]|nr:hypothetical protein [Clostridia bacterium]
MSEFQKTIEKHPFLTMSFLLLLTVALLFENVLMNDAIHVNRQKQKLQSWTDKSFYTLTDTVSQEEEAALWKSDDCILRMKSVVDAFEEAYGYCVYGQQPIVVKGLCMPDEFYNYLRRDEQGNKLYEESDLICRQVNSYAWDLFQMQTVEGRGLQPGDYEYEDEIPVVLGNAYSGYLKVGDVLEGYRQRLKVVGILQPNIVVRFQDRLEQLDWTIVMPSRELPEGMDGRIPYDTQLGTDYRMDYIQKLGGIFALSSENELPELMRFIDETVKKYGIFDLQLMILPPRGVQLLSDVVGQYSQTKQLWTVVMLLLLTLCFARFAALLFRQNARRYAVLLVSGASQGQMLRIVLSGMLTMALISNVLAYAITYLLIGVKYRLSLAALSLVLDAAVSMVMFRRYIQTSEKAVSILERE